MFLVMLSCHADDLPVRLCTTEGEAREFIDGQPDPDQERSEAVENICRILHIDPSEAFGWTMVEFRDGRPVGREIVRWFDDEEEAA